MTFEAMLRTAIQGSLLALVAFAITALTRNLRPGVRAWIWWLVLAQFAFGWLWSAPIRFGTPESFAASPFAQTIVARTDLQITEAAPSTNPIPWLEIVWGAGALALLLAHAWGTISLVRLRRRATPAPEPVQRMARRIAAELGLAAPPEVLVSNGLRSPAAFGLFRPCILLPVCHEELSEAEQTMAMTHELAHLLRKDTVLSLIPEIATVVFWFFPPVHLIRREWTIQRELACDSIVYERTDCPAKDYRRLLLRMVEGDGRRYPKGALGATADFRCLKRRLAAGAPSTSGRFAGVAALSVLTALSLPIAPQNAVQQAGLLLNASFEQGTNEPTGWIRGQRLDGVRYVWDETVAHTGKRSISIQKRADRYFPIAEWSQTVKYDGHSPAIEFSGWVKTVDAHKAVLDVQFATEEGVATHQWAAYIGMKDEKDLPADHDWKPLGGSVKIPKGTKEIVLSLQMYGPGKVWLDDVSARYVNRATTEPNDLQ